MDRTSDQLRGDDLRTPSELASAKANYRLGKTNLQEKDQPLDERNTERLAHRATPVARPDRSQLSDTEKLTLADVGRFRAIDRRDLGRYGYGGNDVHLHQDLRSLREHGLLRSKTVWTGGKRDRLTVLVLTRQGKEWVQSQAAKTDQRVYSGLVKPAEIHHDAAIYRMYQREAECLRKSGKQIQRIVLDYQLKQKIYSVLAKNQHLPPSKRASLQAEVAHQHGLKVIGGKIPLPDLRIEYLTSGGERGHVDLELATEHYRGSQLRAKAEAGFKMYAPGDSAARLSAALDGPELMSEIFSF